MPGGASTCLLSGPSSFCRDSCSPRWALPGLGMLGRGDMTRREGTCWQEDVQLKKAQLEGTAGAWGSRD